MELAAICQTFGCTPDKAVALRGWKHADLTRGVMDAIDGARLKEEASRRGGAKGWTARDHARWKELCNLTGRTQAPIQREPEIGDGGRT